jgi:hypothetical protein
MEADKISKQESMKSDGSAELGEEDELIEEEDTTYQRNLHA